MSDIDKVLKERGSRYGEYAEHARITQAIKTAIMSGVSWIRCSDAQREALDMIAHKIGRIVNGDPNYDDSWVDIVGYTQLVINELSTTRRQFAGELPTEPHVVGPIWTTKKPITDIGHATEVLEPQTSKHTFIIYSTCGNYCKYVDRHTYEELLRTNV